MRRWGRACLLSRAGCARVAAPRHVSSATENTRFFVEGELTKLPAGELPAVGVEAQLTHSFSLEDTRTFARLAGDNNPLHVDATFARAQAAESAPVVQGLLSASLFATIFGRTIPGALYVKQDFRWRAPLLVDEQVTARIRVTRVRRRFVECETICAKTEDGVVVVDGHATVLLPAAPANHQTS